MTVRPFSVVPSFKKMKLFRHSAVRLKQFQRLLRYMASSAGVVPPRSMHMRPLQHWLQIRVPWRAWHTGRRRMVITPFCRRTLTPWSPMTFLRTGVPLGQGSRHVVVTTGASLQGWGAVCNGHAVSGQWTGPRLHWHINCLELLAVLLALRRLQPLLQDMHVLVRSDSTAALAYINRQGGIRSRQLTRLSRRLLLWSQQVISSLRATHIPGVLNQTADALSHQSTPRGEWRLHPRAVRLIWEQFGQAQVDLFASPDSTHCLLWYSLNEAPLGMDALAHSWPWYKRKYAFPPVSLIAQTLCKVREEEHQVVLVAPYWPNRTWFSELRPLTTTPPWPLGGYTPISVASSRPGALLGEKTRGVDRSGTCCPFLKRDWRVTSPPSTLGVYVAAMAAHHDSVAGKPLGLHYLVIRFLRCARRRPPHPCSIPSCDRWRASIAPPLRAPRSCRSFSPHYKDGSPDGAHLQEGMGPTSTLRVHRLPRTRAR
ncbi:uncharacterized protein LOC130557741 [Triplophysa rosa]|uniref:uncharacterized protein LOC130557741 n=1 Tax=Triplophysa rosa TaxID=992332 RepID=UPI0025460FA5|nr:uncharacterized protein LOC130557741 [Triplophysa rosa]